MIRFSKICQALLTGLFALCLLLPGAASAQPARGDVTLAWNTFLGGNGAEYGGQSVAVDADGNAYVVGSSFQPWSCDPIPCTVRAFGGGEDGFVAKLSPSGVLLWNTFQGSTGSVERTNGVAVDDSGGLYITGWSTDDWSGLGSAAFIAKLNASDGVLQWVIFIDYSIGTGVVADNNGNLYAVGQSFDWWGCAAPVNCTTRPFTGGSGYLYDAYVAKFNASTGVLLWNAFLGDVKDDWGSALALDPLGNVYMVGAGKGTWGSPIRAYNPGDGDPFHVTDVFAAKLNNDGALQWNTFLGGDGSEDYDIIHSYYRGIAVDGDGNAYVAGNSTSAWGCAPVACTVRAYTPYGTNESKDAFVAKLTTDGALLWNTFLGTIMDDVGNSIAADLLGNTYVAGKSGASWGTPVRPFTNYDDAFAAKLNTNGALMWNTFLGRGDSGNGLARDAVGNIYVAGTAAYANWGNPVRPINSGSQDLFVAKLPLLPPMQAKTLKSIALQDGWILASTIFNDKGGRKDNTSTTLRLGDDAECKQYRSILSFGTGALPDAAFISSVKLKVRKQGIAGGGNPVTALRGFMLDIKKGTLGAPTLEPTDFQIKAPAASYKTLGPYTPAADTNGWYSITLPATVFRYINKLSGSSGLTQIRLRFQMDCTYNDRANYLGLYSGNAAAASQPQLVVGYYSP